MLAAAGVREVPKAATAVFVGTEETKAALRELGLSDEAGPA